MSEPREPTVDQVAEKAQEGKARLSENTNRWSGSLEALSVQLAYATIGANWAAHGTTASILDSGLATLSIGSAVLFLALNVLLLGINSQIMWKRMHRAEHDDAWWTNEARRKLRDSTHSFPFARASGRFSIVLRWLRLVVPGAAGLLFVFSLL